MTIIESRKNKNSNAQQKRRLEQKIRLGRRLEKLANRRIRAKKIKPEELEFWLDFKARAPKRMEQLQMMQSDIEIREILARIGTNEV